MKLFFSAPNYRVLVREAEKRAVNLPCLDEAKNITKVTVQNTDIRTGLMCKGCDQKADILVSMLVSVCVFVWSAVCMLRASSVAVERDAFIPLHAHSTVHLEIHKRVFIYLLV